MALKTWHYVLGAIIILLAIGSMSNTEPSQKPKQIELEQENTGNKISPNQNKVSDQQNPETLSKSGKAIDDALARSRNGEGKSQEGSTYVGLHPLIVKPETPDSGNQSIDDAPAKPKNGEGESAHVVRRLKPLEINKGNPPESGQSKKSENKEVRTAADFIGANPKSRQEQSINYPARNGNEYWTGYSSRTERWLQEKYTALGYDIVPRPVSQFSMDDFGQALQYIDEQGNLAAQMQMEEEAIMQQELTSDEFHLWKNYKSQMAQTRAENRQTQDALEQEQQALRDQMLEADLRVKRITQY